MIRYLAYGYGLAALAAILLGTFTGLVWASVLLFWVGGACLTLAIAYLAVGQRSAKAKPSISNGVARDWRAASFTRDTQRDA